MIESLPWQGKHDMQVEDVSCVRLLEAEWIKAVLKPYELAA